MVELCSPGSTVLHVPPCDAPTVKTVLVPPVPNPVASDIVRRKSLPFSIGSGSENVPLPLLNALAGIETLRGDPNT